MKFKNVTRIIFMSSVLFFFVYYLQKDGKKEKVNQTDIDLLAKNEQQSSFLPMLTNKTALSFSSKEKIAQEKDTTNTVSLDTAKAWTSAWRSANPSATATRSYFVPAVDLVEVLNEIGVISDSAMAAADTTNQGVRVYMAIEKTGKTSIDKILIVGTELDSSGVHRDIINGTIDGKGTRPPNTTSGIFDFTSPCPNTCDDQSPLDN